MIDGVRRYGHYCGATGKLGTEYVMQAATFFGPDKRYAETWEPPANGAKKKTYEDYSNNLKVKIEDISERHEPIRGYAQRLD